VLLDIRSGSADSLAPVRIALASVGRQPHDGCEESWASTAHARPASSVAHRRADELEDFRTLYRLCHGAGSGRRRAHRRPDALAIVPRQRTMGQDRWNFLAAPASNTQLLLAPRFSLSHSRGMIATELVQLFSRRRGLRNLFGRFGSLAVAFVFALAAVAQAEDSKDPPAQETRSTRHRRLT